MANELTITGPVFDTANQTLDSFYSAYRLIYGQDTQFESNTADGQKINIFALSVEDIKNLSRGIIANLDPLTATGYALDIIASYSALERKGASKTQQQIQVITDRTTLLYGVNDSNLGSNVPFKVSDATGTIFVLKETITVAAGTHLLDFEAEEFGAIITTANTITNQSTTVLGVVSINNLLAASFIGISAESDADFRARIKESKANTSSSNYGSTLAAVRDISGTNPVTNAALYENRTSVTDSNGIPANSIWLIVEGGNDQEIAQTVLYKGGFMGFKGSVSVLVNNSNTTGSKTEVKFDRPTLVNLYIKFDLKRKDITQNYDLTAIKKHIITNLTYTISQEAVEGEIYETAFAAINDNGGKAFVINVGLSTDGINYFPNVSHSSLDGKWVVDPNNINITVV
jgi:uncharacterized phage protein gp47/JayE